ncbi:MAG: hypothetical protein LBG65_01315 [Puniceicoccales bacterium]|nr:hypothetical protein [Puniceicoccales bacterium]
MPAKNQSHPSYANRIFRPVEKPGNIGTPNFIRILGVRWSNFSRRPVAPVVARVVCCGTAALPGKFHHPTGTSFISQHIVTTRIIAKNELAEAWHLISQ